LGGFFFFNRQPLVEAKFLPGWDERRGVPFGDSLPQGRTGACAQAGDLPTGPHQKDFMERLIARLLDDARQVE
jgi:hypothetical protein